MADEQTVENGLTIASEKQTAPRDNKKAGLPKKKNGKTMKQGAGLNKIKQDELVKWTIHVQEETRAFVGKASVKAGLTQTDWIDSRLQQTARNELSSKPKPPAKPEDLVADIVKQFADQLENKQAATAEQQNALIEKQGEQIAALTEAIKNQPAPPPPPSLKELIFGKSKKD